MFVPIVPSPALSRSPQKTVAGLKLEAFFPERRLPKRSETHSTTSTSRATSPRSSADSHPPSHGVQSRREPSKLLFKQNASRRAKTIVPRLRAQMIPHALLRMFSQEYPVRPVKTCDGSLKSFLNLWSEILLFLRPVLCWVLTVEFAVSGFPHAFGNVLEAFDCHSCSLSRTNGIISFALVSKSLRPSLAQCTYKEKLPFLDNPKRIIMPFLHRMKRYVSTGEATTTRKSKMRKTNNC
jgi:hypothetical protein